MSAVTMISEVPTFITPDEYRTLSASTPASFSSIPPVLRHKEENVSITLDPPVDGFGAEDSTNGTLYVIESVLVFMSITGRGFQVEYPSITLHAISRAEAGPSIYCQLDEQPAAGDEAPAPAENGEEATDMRELIIVPRDPSALEPIFEGLSVCASLHPDPNDENEIDDDDDGIFVDADLETFNGGEEQELSEVGRAALAHLESIIYNPFENQQDSGIHSENEVTEPQVNGVRHEGPNGQFDDAS